MVKYQALFLDIDGTIVMPDNTIEPITRKVIAEVLEQGLTVILTTGRPVHEITDLAEELNVDSLIGYNGASAMINGRTIYKNTFHVHTVEKIVYMAMKHGHQIALHTSSANYLTDVNSPIAQKFVKQFNYKKNELLQLTKDILEDVLSITFINLQEKEAKLYDRIDDLLLSQANVEGMQQCFDVFRKNVNKGTGVQIILEQLGIQREQAIAFGDGLNDKEMLMNVGASFAMGNSHPNLFSFAKYRTTDVTNAGVYYGLKKIGLVD